MAISLQKSTVVKVVGVSLVMLLAACSTDQRYKRQVSGDESYLTAPGLKPLNAPSGMILPVQNGEFDVRTVNSQGAVGQTVGYSSTGTTTDIIEWLPRRKCNRYQQAIVRE